VRLHRKVTTQEEAMHDSLEAFIASCAEIGETRTVHGASLDEEVGVLTELSAEARGPMLVFDRFEGYPEGHRVCVNPLRTRRRFARAFDLPLDAHPLELLSAWRARRKSIGARVSPRTVTDGPVLTRMQSGADVDLESIPAPRWHERDGGKYIGTADMVVLRDPDQGWVNVGVYRGMIQGPNRLSLWILAAKHGRMIAEKYWARGEPAPIAVVLGSDPVTWMTAAMAAPYGTSEYDLAGAFRGAPVDVVDLPVTGLPVPANAEIVLEGRLPSPEEDSAYEGPFGEWPGYYSHEGHEPVMTVERIYHRDRPILLGTPPLRPLGDSDSVAVPSFTLELWDHLERGGITDVTGVWGFCKTLMTVISVRQRYPGHAKQALLAAAGFRSGASMYRYYVVVDEDIDVTNLEEVVWAMCTRVDPATSMEIIRNAWTTKLDPRLSPDQIASGDLTMGRLLIDACKPYVWRDQFPASNVFSREVRARVAHQWEDLLQGLHTEESGLIRPIGGSA
jgi:UbiD family decarboxylase